MKTFSRYTTIFLMGLAASLPLHAGQQYEELAKKILTHIPQQAKPVHLSILDFKIPEDKNGLDGAQHVKDELEIELGRDSRVKLITSTHLESPKAEWDSEGQETATPESQAKQAMVGEIDVLVGGYVSVEANGEVCIYAELMNVGDGSISKEKVSWMPASARPAPEPQPAYIPVSREPDYAGERSDLQPMIDRMAALRCREESSKLYQRRLLMLLPMIRDGADVNMTTLETKGNTALHYAVAIGSLSITRWLLEHGANPNAVTDKGASVMQCVGSDNHSQITSLLLQYGASGASYAPAPRNYGGYRGDLQPMIDRMAALRCREESSKLYQRRLLMLLPMIRDGADVNMTTLETKGNTALHYAVAIGSLSITRWLLEHGANPNAVTDKGASVMQCVGSDNHQQITSLLRQYGAY